MSNFQGHVLGHLMRRGVEYTQAAPAREIGLTPEAIDFEKLQYDMPTWGVILIGGTLLGFTIILASLRYTIGHVIATLAMIEEPETAVVIETKPAAYTDEEPDATIAKAPLLDVEQTITLAQTKPITSKIRTTLAHLTAHGGFGMRWRGLGVAVLYGLLRFWLAGFLFAIIPFPYEYNSIKMVIVAGLSALGLAKLHCLWTHVTVTKPWGISLHKYRKTHGSNITWRALAVPTLAAAVSEESSLQLVNILARTFAEENEQFSPTFAKAAIQIVLVLGVAITLAICTVLPAIVQLTRVEASLLPEEIETLVPFDRTFGGRVQAGMVGINVVRIKAARQSFGWPQIKRLLGVYVKMFFILTAICAVAFHVVGLEVYVVMGDVLKKLVAAGVAEARAGNYRL